MFFRADQSFDSSETLRQFRRDLLPVLTRYGPEIGERAMQGDEDAELLVRRYAIFQAWLDPVNLALLQRQMQRYLKKMEH